MSDPKPRRILLAAGGTGGHLFPAEALAGELVKAGIEVHLATDRRGMAYGGAFPAEGRHAIRAATPSGKSPRVLVGAVAALAQGLLQSLILIRRLRPQVVIGFGGYPSVPPLLAARLLGIPAFVHEQNGVIGRANRFLGPHVRIIGTGLKEVAGLSPALATKVRHVGNPVRPAVLAAAETAFAPLVEGMPFRILVTGGSQGARTLSDVVPRAVGLLTPDEKARLSIVHQARADDVSLAEMLYRDAGAAVEVRSFFEDLPARIAASHLVIGRAGASTVAELAVIGRPAILVPLPGALDQDQAANAAALGKIGAAIVIAQRDFTPEALADYLRGFLADPRRLTDSSQAAKSAGSPDAAARFAALIAETIGMGR